MADITPYEPEQLQEVADQAIPWGEASEHVWPNLVVFKLLATLKALVAGSC